MSKKQAKKAARAAALAPAPSLTSLDDDLAYTGDVDSMVPGSLLSSTASAAAPSGAQSGTAALQPSTLLGAAGVTSPHAVEPNVSEPALRETEGLSDRGSKKTNQHGITRDHANHVSGQKTLLHWGFQERLDMFMHDRRQEEDKNPYQALAQSDEAAAATVADDGQAGREAMPDGNLATPDHCATRPSTEQPKLGLANASMSAVPREAAQQRQPGKVLTLPRPRSSPRQPERSLPVGPISSSQATAQHAVHHNKV